MFVKVGGWFANSLGSLYFHLQTFITFLSYFASSLGDVLVNITTDGKSLNMEKRMKDNGFPTEGLYQVELHSSFR